MVTSLQALLIMLLVGAVTFFTRVLPFLFFPDNKEKPGYVLYLGKVLPLAIMGMLIVYCIKDASFFSWPFCLPELIAIAAVALLHIWKHNTLLSVGVGTILYMVLVQFVFI